MIQQIIIKNIEKPNIKDKNIDIDWFCNSFGFSSGRDTENISTRIINEIIEKMQLDARISSELIASDLDISTSRVNHHIRNLVESGFIYRQNRHIFLRGGSLKSAVDSIRKDTNSILDAIEEIAKEIDDAIGLKNR
ncbi:winged helix-turn-helix transcriptional regulator [Candidatus Woesearchaeota archaeon]|nr:winged helix-turn-helix transcriptional regulator [Candidatus Woesearchaeota archaeon]